MTVHDHVFVRDPPPLDGSAFCPLCREPWAWCACDLPEYRGTWLAKLYPEEKHDDRRKAA
jgi:hypothetical protein